jgi:hypothetical protein
MGGWEVAAPIAINEVTFDIFFPTGLSPQWLQSADVFPWLFRAFMRIEFVSQVFLCAERIVVEGIWRKKFPLALRAASHGWSLVDVLQNDESAFCHDGRSLANALVDYLPLDFGFFYQHVQHRLSHAVHKARSCLSPTMVASCCLTRARMGFQRFVVNQTSS